MFEEFFGSGSVDVGKGLAIAEDLERRSIIYYNGKAGEVGALEGKRLFEFLAGEEKRHLQAINALASQVAGGAIEWAREEAAVKPNIFKGFGERRADSEVALQDNVIAAALEAEKESMEFYAKFAEKIPDKQGKRFFKKLAEFEKTHFDLLSELLDLGRRPVEAAGYPEDFAKG